MLSIYVDYCLFTVQVKIDMTVDLGVGALAAVRYTRFK
jgi:hypothetical protein